MVSANSIKQVNTDWARFLEALKRKDKNSRKLRKLEIKDRIAQFKTLKGNEQKEYAETLLWLFFETGSRIPIMSPQLWIELFPYVKQKYEAREMPYVRWLYHAFSFPGVYDYLKCNPADVLRLALELEPDNQKVAELLYCDHMSTLDFALHEIPWGLCADQSYCLDVVEEAKNLRTRFSHLKTVKCRVWYDLDLFDQVLNDWLIYVQNGRKGVFHDRRYAT